MNHDGVIMAKAKILSSKFWSEILFAKNDCGGDLVFIGIMHVCLVMASLNFAVNPISHGLFLAFSLGEGRGEGGA